MGTLLTRSKEHLHSLEYLRECRGRTDTTPVLQGQASDCTCHTRRWIICDAKLFSVVVLDPIHELGLVQQALKQAEAIAQTPGEVWHALLGDTWHLRPRTGDSSRLAEQLAMCMRGKSEDEGNTKARFLLISSERVNFFILRR